MYVLDIHLSTSGCPVIKIFLDSQRYSQVVKWLNRMDNMETGLNSKIDKLDGRVDQLDCRVDRLDGRIDQPEYNMNMEFQAVRTEMEVVNKLLM